MRRLRILVVAAITLVAAAWGEGAPGEGRLNVLLVTVDTLRADRLGCYGDTRAQTPWIDRLAAQGVRFDHAHGHNVVTLASHANILSGRYPFDHGVRDNEGYRFPPNLDTLATILKRRGYRTGAFVSAFPLDSRFGLARGFGVYDDRLGASQDALQGHVEERAGTRTAALAERWLQEGGEPYFCWVHLYEPHDPYRPPEPFATRLHDDLYRGEVAAADAALRPLLEPLLVAGRRGRTLVVLTGDHGEALGEHGELTHGIFAYESTLHVPLIVFDPRRLKPGVVQEYVRHVDILPTVLDSLGLSLPKGLPGRSLVPLVAGQALSVGPSYFEALTPMTTRGWAPLHGVLQGSMKYIDLPIRELYDVQEDPRESQNLAPARPEQVRRSLQLLDRLRAADPETPPAQESEEVVERLRSLGYISASASVGKRRYTEDDDPKRQVWFEQDLAKVVELETKGDLRRALEVCQGLVRRMPGATIGFVRLAAIQHRMGDLPGALATLKQAYRKGPTPQVVALLGWSLVESGQASDAVRLLMPYKEQPDVYLDAIGILGVALDKAGRHEEALSMLREVRRRAPADSTNLLNIAGIHLGAKEYAEAETAYKAALAVEPNLPQAHEFLGAIDIERGRFDSAIVHWKRVVSLDPKQYGTLLNLGLLLIQLGRPDEARPYLERFVAGAPPASYGPDIQGAREWIASREAARPKAH